MSNELQGWQPDPYRRHELRYFSAGTPTYLVRDGMTEGSDPVAPDLGAAVAPVNVGGPAGTDRVNGYAPIAGPADSVNPIAVALPTSPSSPPATFPINSETDAPTSWPAAFPGYSPPGMYTAPPGYPPPAYGSPYGYGSPAGYPPYGYPALPPGYLPPGYPPEAFGYAPPPGGYPPVEPNGRDEPPVSTAPPLAQQGPSSIDEAAPSPAAVASPTTASPTTASPDPAEAARTPLADSVAASPPSTDSTSVNHSSFAPGERLAGSDAAAGLSAETPAPVGEVPPPEALASAEPPGYAIPVYAVLVYALPSGPGASAAQLAQPMYLPLPPPADAALMYGSPAADGPFLYPPPPAARESAFLETTPGAPPPPAQVSAPAAPAAQPVPQPAAPERAAPAHDGSAQVGPAGPFAPLASVEPGRFGLRKGSPADARRRLRLELIAIAVIAVIVALAIVIFG